MIGIDIYKIVITVLCKYYHFTEDELYQLLNNKESKYLLLLLLNEHNCLNKEKLIEELKFKNCRSITYNLKVAEEKLLVNKAFREDYFSLKNKIQKES